MATAQPEVVQIDLDPGPDAGPDDAERSTAQLRNELRQLHVEGVELGRGRPAPPGAKGDGATLAQLLVTLGEVPGVLPAVVGAVLDWLTRDRSRRVVIELQGDRLELSAASAQDQHALINSWLARHPSTDE
jgi:hypothetical protein